MDQESCSKSMSADENPSGSLLEVVVNNAGVTGQTSNSVSEKALIEEQVDVSKENDSRTAIQEEVVDDVTTVVSCHDAQSDTSNAKAKDFHVVDLNGGGETDNGQRICRICHFGSDQSPDRVSGEGVTSDLIEIGCKCKNELGLAHFHCAEAWFKIRRNSLCEICGCTAKNVTLRLTEERSEARDITMDERRRRGRGKSCCIFMVFLLMVLMLHWFFKKISDYYKRT